MILILVVVDNGLVLIKKISDRKEQKSLNPCCSGQWSRTALSIHSIFSLTMS